MVVFILFMNNPNYYEGPVYLVLRRYYLSCQLFDKDENEYAYACYVKRTAHRRYIQTAKRCTIQDGNSRRP